MPELSADLKELLKRINVAVFPEDFCIVYLPIGIKTIAGEWFRPATTRFAAVIQEPKMITMVIPRRKWLRMQNMYDRYDVEGPMKVISFDVKLSLVWNGCLSKIGALLTDANIRSTPISSFKRDHIVVPKTDLPRAIRILRDFFAGGRNKVLTGPQKPVKKRRAADF